MYQTGKVNFTPSFSKGHSYIDFHGKVPHMTFRGGEGVKWWEDCDVLCYIENKIKKKVKLNVILNCTPWILGCHLKSVAV